MKKYVYAMLLVVFTVLLLTACSCEHEWENATCTAPVTCTKCGETAGEALGHKWVEATCTTPKTCSVCNMTEGNITGHTWVNATCTVPKKCSICGETDGGALGHKWENATCITPKKCSICGETDGEALGHKWENATCTDPQKCSICGEVGGNASGHQWNSATCTAPKKCSVCGETEGEAKGHSYGKGKCTTCGQIDPDYIKIAKRAYDKAKYNTPYPSSVELSTIQAGILAGRWKAVFIDFYALDKYGNRKLYTKLYMAVGDGVYEESLTSLSSFEEFFEIDEWLIR